MFLCGGDVADSTFADNEASLFGAVVNGDLSDSDRLDATALLGAAAGENYTCPPLSVSGTTFDGNGASKGYGGAIASVDASLSVFNCTIKGSLGGGLYFGTSDDTGRDRLEVSCWCFFSGKPRRVGKADFGRMHDLCFILRERVVPKRPLTKSRKKRKFGECRRAGGTLSSAARLFLGVSPKRRTDTRLARGWCRTRVFAARRRGILLPSSFDHWPRVRGG